VDNRSFDVRPGTVTGFLGPNGAAFWAGEAMLKSPAPHATLGQPGVLRGAAFWAGEAVLKSPARTPPSASPACCARC